MCEKLTPRRALPSLNALKAFEAMGRTGGATRAAVELNVTHSAISRQVKALERALGVRLFEGPRHHLMLTPDGRRLLKGLTPAFDVLFDAVDAVRAHESVRLAVHSSLAVKWLIPRVPEFQRRNAGMVLDLRDLPITATRDREADLVVRFLDGTLADHTVERLADNHIGVVCSAALATSVATAVRLTALSHPRGWNDWGRLSETDLPGGPIRNLAHLHFVLDAALAGLGVAVLPWIIVADAIEAGALVAPFGFVADPESSLVAIRMRDEVSRPTRETLKWLRHQASETVGRVPLVDPGSAGAGG